MKFTFKLPWGKERTDVQAPKVIPASLPPIPAVIQAPPVPEPGKSTLELVNAALGSSHLQIEQAEQLNQQNIAEAVHASFETPAAPAQAEESNMSLFTNIATGLSKAENFLINVFTKTSEVEKTFASLAPATKAAILATFYDTAKAVAAAEGAATAAAAGAIPTAITLSTQTLSLVKNVITDAKTDGSVFAADLKALGL